MPNPLDIVQLVVGGLVYEGWTSVHVARGVERMSAEFSVSVTPKDAVQISPINFPLGAPAQVLIGPDLVVTGFAEDAAPSFGKDTRSLAVEGRSRTCDLVDCCSTHATGQFKLQTALQIITQLAAEYGIGVTTDVPQGAPIPRFTIKRDETIGAAIGRLCEQAGLLATDDAAGNLVLTRPGLRRATTPLVQGVNIKSAEARYSSTELFSEYRCKGSRPGNDVDFGASVAAVQGVAVDPSSLRRRVTVLSATGPASLASATERANWEASTRAGRAVTASVVVQGWRQADGRLWTPGEVVPVSSTWLGIVGDMVITECSFDLGEGEGTTTTLALALPDAYLATPPKAKRGGAGGGGGALYFTGGV